jgi:hypothetical protein
MLKRKINEASFEASVAILTPTELAEVLMAAWRASAVPGIDGGGKGDAKDDATP